jgi:hypothetical protein
MNLHKEKETMDVFSVQFFKRIYFSHGKHPF